MQRDRLGRRRSPGQERGLRPLHPPLPEEWMSRVLRVAMSESDWARLESLVARHAVMAPTQARAYGMALSTLLNSGAEGDAGPVDWLDWERRKTLRLLMANASFENRRASG